MRGDDMPKAARLGDLVKGMTSGEHHGHTDNPHDPCELNGVISKGSNNVFINGKPASIVGNDVSETDCDGTGTGVLTKGSSTVFINGKPAVRMGDKTTPHDGTAEVITGSSNVFIGG